MCTTSFTQFLTVGVSLFAAYSAYRSSQAAQQNAYRAHSPKFKAFVEKAHPNEQGKPTLNLVLLEPNDFEKVEVKLLPPDPVRFTANQNGVSTTPNDPQTSALWATDKRKPARLEVGETANWKVEWPEGTDPDGREVMLRITAATRDYEWSVTETAQVIDSIEHTRQQKTIDNVLKRNGMQPKH